MAKEKNREIHYRYVIIFLALLLIGALSFQWYSIPRLEELIAFSAALTSIILAVVAIFQTYFSSSALEGAAQSTTESASEIRKSAEELSKATLSLQSKIDGLPEVLADISEEVRLTRADIGSMQFGFTSNSGSKTEKVRTIGRRSDNTDIATTRGGVVTFYIMLKACKNGNSFRSPDLGDPLISGYTQGYLEAIRVFRIASINRTDDDFQVTSLNEFDEQSIIGAMSKLAEEHSMYKDLREKIDAIFDNPSP